MQKLLKYWQRKLNLNDWFIVLEDDCPCNEFIEQGRQGECDWDTTNKSAIIRLIHEREYGQKIMPYIKEKVLIHELLHIKFAFLWQSNNDIQNDLLHQYIEDLARTLYNEHNKNKKEK